MMLHFEKERRNLNIKIYIHIIYYVHMYAYVFSAKRKALRTNQKLVNMITHRKWMGTR